MGLPPATLPLPLRSLLDEEETRSERPETVEPLGLLVLLCLLSQDRALLLVD